MPYPTDKILQGTLDFVNEVRAIMGEPPLGKLVRGERGMPRNCPISNSVRCSKIIRASTGVHCLYLTLLNPEDTSIFPGGYSVGDDIIDGVPYQMVVIPLSDNASLFREKFDWGEYPQLEVRDE